MNVSFVHSFLRWALNRFRLITADEFITSDPEDSIDPLIRAGKLTQEDWVILEWNESLEAYVLTAGTVCFPMRWSLLEKWNQPMSGIKRF